MTITIVDSPLQQRSLVTPSPLISDCLSFGSLTSTTDESNGYDSCSDESFLIHSEDIPNDKSLRLALGLEKRSTRKQRKINNKPEVVGHRGALYSTLENTRHGFLKCAYNYRCDAVELDVFLLPKDNTLVVFHGSGGDEKPGALTKYCITTEKSINVMDLTYEEVKNLRFDPLSQEFPCPKSCLINQRISYIPKLEQVLLDLRPTKCKIKIELKGPGVVKPVLELVEYLQMQSQCSYSSFDLSKLKELRSLRPDRCLYPTGALFSGIPPNDYIQLAHDVGATEIHLKYDVCTVKNVNEIHAAGLKSMAWFRGPVGMKNDISYKYWDIGNEDELCYQAIIDTGVQQICCNKPNLLRAMLS